MKNDAHGHQVKYPEVSLIYDWILTFGVGTWYPPQKVKIMLLLKFWNLNNNIMLKPNNI